VVGALERGLDGEWLKECGRQARAADWIDSGYEQLWLEVMQEEQY